MMIARLLFSLWIGIVVVGSASGQDRKARWVDSVFHTMDLEKRIGQLFMVSVSPSDENDVDEAIRKLESFGAGGVFIKGGQLRNPGLFIEQLQHATETPLLVAADGQPGNHFSWPSPVMQGAVGDDSLLYALGKEIGRQMKASGIHIGFIPANLAGRFSTSPGTAYSERADIVSAKALAYLRGLREAHVAGVAQYFPVQSVSVTSVGRGLPTIQLTVDSAQVQPFKTLFREGISGVIPASIDLPLFYPNRKVALRNVFSSGMLSASFAGDWIRQHMGYNGLVVVDVENMVRDQEKFRNGDAELFAFQAGNDLLITSDNLNAAFRKIRRLIRRDDAYMNMLNKSVRKILELKYDVGLADQPSPPSPWPEEQVTHHTRVLREQLYRSAVTVVSNRRNILPVQSLENKKFTCLIAGDSATGNLFVRQLSKYVPVSVIHVDGQDERLAIDDPAYGQHVLIAAVFEDADPGVLSMVLPHLKESAINRDVIVCDFGSAAIRERGDEFETVITAWSHEEAAVRNLAQAVFGAFAVEGNLPVSFGQVPAGTALATPSLGRMGYSVPEEVGIDSQTLNQIEKVAREAIDMGATPGCQVLVARKGKVVYERSFGHLTYERQFPVTDQTIYDLASITKVAATLQAIMFLYERGLLDLNAKASWYLPELRGSNKEDFLIRDILTHQAGLWPYLPFWAQTMQDTVYSPVFYNRSLSREYSLVVADNLYANQTMRDSLWQWVIRSRVREKPDRTPYDYRYSDLGFYILQRLAEKLLNQPLDDFLFQNFYEPMGAYTTGYRPLVRFPLRQLAPTENDRLFRKTLLIGTVHDQGAAMMGGVAGHAGLFSNANDLAKLGQMWLQEGEYGGIRYYKPETIRRFARQQHETNRRGLGWDKPTRDWNGPTGIYASPKTFGHTGFTGTCVWVDPEFDLVYVFLSNRVHPEMTNNKLLSAHIRPRIQDIIYQAIFAYCRTQGDPEPGVTSTDLIGTAQ